MKLSCLHCAVELFMCVVLLRMHNRVESGGGGLCAVVTR